MYNKILVALDTLEPVVFETALSIAIATQADLLLLHVLTEHDADSPPAPIPIAWDYASPLSQDSWDAYQKQWTAYVTRSLENLRDYAGRAEADGVTAEFLQINGDPGQSICKSAKTQAADLIVVGSHHRTGLKELFLGSVSNYVVHHTPCSVMVVSLKNTQAASELKAPAEVYQAS